MILIDSREQAISWTNQYDFSTFGFDVETNEEDDYTKVAIHGHKRSGISFYNGQESVFITTTTWTKEDMTSFLQHLTNTKWKNNGKGLQAIAHNIIFDMVLLNKYVQDILYNASWFDTMVADHLINESERHALKPFCVDRYLGIKEAKSYSEMKEKPIKEFYEYAANDAKYTYQIAVQQQSMLKEQGLHRLFTKIEMPYQRALVEMYEQGMLVDLQRVTTTKEQLDKAKTDTIIKMHEVLGEKYELQNSLFDTQPVIKSNINFSSSHQVSKILFDKLGFEPIEYTDKGKPKTGKKTIASLKGKHEFVDYLEQYKIIDKLISAFFNPMPQLVHEDGKIRPRFNDVGTVTGRLSCARPNLQQLPKKNKAFPVDTRAAFIPPPGYKMIACDYSGQELRVLTEITQEPKLIDTFNKGKDLHLATANDFFSLGIEEEALVEGHVDHEMYKDKCSSERNKAKTINFGMAYGKGSYGFSKDLNISKEEAQAILDKYFVSLPRVKAAIDECHRLVDKQGFVTHKWGRRRRFQKNANGYYGNGDKRQAFNFLIQGLSADMIRGATIQTMNLARKNPSWGLKIVGTVHDENIYIVKTSYADKAAQEIMTCFTDWLRWSIPIKAEVKIGNNYGECK